ncbi:myb-like protein D [Oppia nitens]|uniref:myb-like protein D n=1 Tax=Oppia nitens TaxID=1686743 RepID=UPI0023DA1A19|nr:myb-like protein D [Oppia nitens]
MSLTTISMISDDEEEESYETHVQRKNVTNSGNNCVKTIANNVCSTTTAHTIITNSEHKFADKNVDNNGIVSDKQINDPLNTDDNTVDEAFANGNGTHLLANITKVADINDNNDTNSMSMDTNGWPSDDNMTDNDPNTNLILNGSTGDQLTPIDDNNYENEGKENEEKVMDEEVEEQENNNNNNIVDVSTKIRTDFTEVEDKIVVYLYTKVHKRRIIDIKYFNDALQVRYKGQEFDPMDITNDTYDNVIYNGQIEPDLCHHKEKKERIEITVIKKDKKFKWNAFERTVNSGVVYNNGWPTEANETALSLNNARSSLQTLSHIWETNQSSKPSIHVSSSRSVSRNTRRDNSLSTFDTKINDSKENMSPNSRNRDNSDRQRITV